MDSGIVIKISPVKLIELSGYRLNAFVITHLQSWGEL